MTLYTFAQQFALAILVGALVGIEREHVRKEIGKKAIPIFGLRTTILFSILGFLCAFVANTIANNLVIVAGVLLALVVTTAVYASNVWVYKHTGSTTYIAMFIVFFAGVLVGLNSYFNYLMAATLSVTITLILAAKRSMVRWTRKITNEEIIAAVKFGIIAFIILPLLPNKFIDPWNLINPYEVWYVIVAISAIYFVSYILMKELSSKGLIISSFFGGLISGSATVYQLADWIKKKKNLLKSAISGVFIACLTGQISDLIVLFFVFNSIPLLKFITIPYFLSMMALLTMSFVSYGLGKNKAQESVNIKSPFALKPALTFGGFYLFLLVFGGLLNMYFGQWGLLPTTIAGSLFSSSAVIASLANLSNQGVISALTSAKFVIFAASISLVIKIFWVYHAFNKKLTKAVAIGTILSAILMITAFYLQTLLVPF